MKQLLKPTSNGWLRIPAALLLITAGVSASTAHAQTPNTLLPQIVCSDYNQDSGLFNAFLVANNTGQNDAFILVGSDNNFAPGSPNQGQPNCLPVGQSEEFVLSFYPQDDPYYLWHLQNTDLTISPGTSLPCRTSYFTPGAQLTLGSAGRYPHQYLGEVTLAGYAPTASVISNNASVSVSNVQVNITPPPGAALDPAAVYLYGDVTVAAGPATTTSLLISAVQAGQQVAFGFTSVITSASSPDSTGCAADVTKGLSVRSNLPTQLLGTSIYTQLVMVQNTSGKAIPGPVQIALTSLSANARLFNATGTGTCPGIAGAPYVTITNGLAPKAYGSVVLTFTNSQVPSTAITFTPAILSGGARL